MRFHLFIFALLTATSLWAQGRQELIMETRSNKEINLTNCEAQPPLTLEFVTTQECFEKSETAQVCSCLRKNSLSFKYGPSRLTDPKFIMSLFISYNRSTKAAENIKDGFHIATSGDAKTKQAYVDINGRRSFLGKSFDAVTFKGKPDTTFDEIFMEDIKHNDSCISFSDFTVLNSLPKKSFVATLNDPELTIEDFTADNYSGDDHKIISRRKAVKEFMSFNPLWESIFKKGNKTEAFEEIKKIYGRVDADKLKNTSLKNHRSVEAMIMQSRKKAFFNKQKNLSKFYEETKRAKDKELEDSFKIINNNVAVIDRNPEFVESVLKLRGSVTKEECRKDTTLVLSCEGMYGEYCNLKQDPPIISDELRNKIHKAFETVQKNRYVFDRYKEVTNKYCEKQYRVQPEKLSGNYPPAMKFDEFKQLLCKEEKISLKNSKESAKSLCNKNQALLAYFNTQIVDQSLVTKDPYESFETEFLQTYSEVEINTNTVKEAIYEMGGTKNHTKSSEVGFLGSSVDSDKLFGNEEDFRSLKSLSSSSTLANVTNDVTGLNPQSPLMDVPSSTPDIKNDPVTTTAQATANMTQAILNPTIAQTYALPANVPVTTPYTAVTEYKEKADSQVKVLEQRIDALNKKKEEKEAADRQQEVASLQKELDDLKTYSQSLSKILDEKKESRVVANQVATVIDNGRAPASAYTHHVAATQATATPSQTYDDYFADASFHPQTSVNQSAAINKQVQSSTSKGDALASIFTNPSIKNLLDKSENQTAGNLVLLASPIELTEGTETKFESREVSVDQNLIDEIKLNPDRIKSFFKDNQIEHVGLLTLKTAQNTKVSYMMRKDEKGKTVVIPVNIARKFKVDTLRNTLQVNAH